MDIVVVVAWEQPNKLESMVSLVVCMLGGIWKSGVDESEN